MSLSSFQIRPHSAIPVCTFWCICHRNVYYDAPPCNAYAAQALSALTDACAAQHALQFIGDNIPFWCILL
jgi:hypothetical protein